MLGINARVEDLREQIIKDINTAQMPACILDYILTEILNDVRMQRMSEVQKERRLYKEEKKAEAVEAGKPVPGEVPVPWEMPVPRKAVVAKRLKKEGEADSEEGGS